MFLSKNNNEFTPFNLMIIPHWDKILKDYGWVEKKDYKKLNDFLMKLYEGEITQDNSNSLYNNLFYSFLSPDILYDNNTKRFFSNFEFIYGFKQKFLRKKEMHLFLNFPIFIISNYLHDKSGFSQHGYRLSISTPETSTKEGTFEDENHQVTIATIPYILFEPYYRKDIPDSFWSKQKQELDSFGWKNDEELGDLDVNVIQHQYFEIRDWAL